MSSRLPFELPAGVTTDALGLPLLLIMKQMIVKTAIAMLISMSFECALAQDPLTK